VCVPQERQQKTTPGGSIMVMHQTVNLKTLYIGGEHLTGVSPLVSRSAIHLPNKGYRGVVNSRNAIISCRVELLLWLPAFFFCARNNETSTSTSESGKTTDNQSPCPSAQPSCEKHARHSLCTQHLTHSIVEIPSRTHTFDTVPHRNEFRHTAGDEGGQWKL
jgi:hypothetical protein